MNKLSLLLLFVTTNVFALSGREVMDQVHANNVGYIGSNSRMTMTLIDAHGNKVERVMTSKVLENQKKGDKSITAFEKPLDVKGTKLLTWTSKKSDEANKQWLYLPNFKRVKKINAKNQAGSFMGSEFSYEDIAGQEISKYTYKMLNDKGDVWVIEYKPKKKSGYSKLITTISKKKHNPIKVQYFDRRGDLLKESSLEDFKTYKVGKKSFYLAGKISMKNLQTKKRSIIVWSKRKLGIKHKEKDFKSTKLK